MKRTFLLMTVILSMNFFCACKDKDKDAKAPAGKDATPMSPDQMGAPVANPEPKKEVAAPQKAPEKAPAAGPVDTIGAFFDTWKKLFDENERVINQYEGMPILELVTPQLVFVSGVQYDQLNRDKQEGRFDGTLIGAGFKGFVERKGSTISFGYDDKLTKDGFGPTDKAGDRKLENGTLDLAKGHYRTETATERDGKKIHRLAARFSRQGDGSMACVHQSGQVFDARGKESPKSRVIFLHNGKDRYDFVVGESDAGTDFGPLQLPADGDLDKAQALKAFTDAGYKIVKSGGIVDGKLTLDKQGN